jgi:protein disulfide-isomerase-like protein
MSFLKADLFPKLEDYVLQDATLRGATLSICAFISMILLAVIETTAYLETDFSTSIIMDQNPNSQMRVNFNITMHDLSCDFATIDLFDMIGTNRQNITSTVEKWQLDDDGRRRMYQGRNRDQMTLDHDNHLHPELHVLHENGVHAPEITKNEWSDFVAQNEFVFVDFYAPWCIWCQRLAPTWEKFAEDVEEAQLPIAIAKVNCVTEGELCRDQRIMAFPSMRFFKEGQPVNAADYRADRTVDALMEFAKRKLELESQYKKWPEARKAHATNWNPDHPGCLLVGFLLVNRVPGNFHIEARSKNHNLHASMANLSHTINHLSFGTELTDHQKNFILSHKGVDVPAKFSPLDKTDYITTKPHESFHHYMKVVGTHYDLGRAWSSKLFSYQLLGSNQMMPYSEDGIPEAKFMYDISPMAVLVEKKSRHFYDYITSLLAILGGTFTVVSLIDNSIYFVMKPKAD